MAFAGLLGKICASFNIASTNSSLLRIGCTARIGGAVAFCEKQLFLLQVPIALIDEYSFPGTNQAVASSSRTSDELAPSGGRRQNTGQQLEALCGQAVHFTNLETELLRKVKKQTD